MRLQSGFEKNSLRAIGLWLSTEGSRQMVPTEGIHKNLYTVVKNTRPHLPMYSGWGMQMKLPSGVGVREGFSKFSNSYSHVFSVPRIADRYEFTGVMWERHSDGVVTWPWLFFFFSPTKHLNVAMNTVQTSNGEKLTGRLWRKQHTVFNKLPFYCDLAKMDTLQVSLKDALSDGFYSSLLIVRTRRLAIMMLSYLFPHRKWPRDWMKFIPSPIRLWWMPFCENPSGCFLRSRMKWGRRTLLAFGDSCQNLLCSIDSARRWVWVMSILGFSFLERILRKGTLAQQQRSIYFKNVHWITYSHLDTRRNQSAHETHRQISPNVAWSWKR